jgi:hypothetical protein
VTHFFAFAEGVLGRENSCPKPNNVSAVKKTSDTFPVRTLFRACVRSPLEAGRHSSKIGKPPRIVISFFLARLHFWGYADFTSAASCF